MSKSLDEIRQEVWDHLKDSQRVYLATAEANQPRVRPVTLLDIDEKFWIATGTRSQKARQILRNPNVEFCLPLSADCGEGYIRVAGVAGVVTDTDTKAMVAEKIPFIGEYWSGPQDPSFFLIRITRVEIEYMRPGEQDAITFIV